MQAVSPLSVFPASGLLPVLPTKPRSVSDDEAAIRIELLRRRQLERQDVRERLIQYAMQRREATWQQ